VGGSSNVRADLAAQPLRRIPHVMLRQEAEDRHGRPLQLHHLCHPVGRQGAAPRVARRCGLTLRLISLLLLLLLLVVVVVLAAPFWQ
jgi:hypothetical protein